MQNAIVWHMHIFSISSQICYPQDQVVHGLKAVQDHFLTVLILVLMDGLVVVFAKYKIYIQIYSP